MPSSEPGEINGGLDIDSGVHCYNGEHTPGAWSCPCKAVCLEGRSPVDVGRELGLSGTTARNIAQRTQRELARRQHQLDEWSDCDALGYYYDCLALHLENVQMAWESSREPGDRTKTTTTTTTVTLPGGERQVGDKVIDCQTTFAGPPPTGNTRLLAMAGATLCNLIAIGQEYKRRRAEEEDERHWAVAPDVARPSQALPRPGSPTRPGKGVLRRRASRRRGRSRARSAAASETAASGKRPSPGVA